MSGEVVETSDVLIVGAGLSGVGAAAQLTREHPGRSYVVLESRGATGGTWDLFRYPGVRSDSDMFTLGYRFKPWLGEKSLADGPTILDYVRETAREYGVDRRTRYHHTVTGASWETERATWRVTAETPDGTRVLETSVLWVCSGYYDYEQGYRPELPGLDDFAGPVIHPQHWPEDFDHTGQRILVVGSGSTAVTLVPALADSGADHVTMLQRSPTYVMAVPAIDPIASRFRRRLPEQAAYRAARWKNVVTQMGLFALSRRRPDTVRGFIRKENRKLLPDGYDVDTHFRPTYDPWDQRLCLAPDGDLFAAISRGDADVVTDTIETFTPSGVRLTSGQELKADVVITATGLNLKAFAEVELFVDGAKVEVPTRMAYKALMLSGVPNLVFTIGYTNASWTLKADLVGEYLCRLLNHLDAHRHRYFVPEREDDVEERPFMDFTPGYVLRALDRLPTQGDREPWRLRQSYLHDVRTIRRGDIDDGVLRFG